MQSITANMPTSQFNRSSFQKTNRHNQADFPNVIRHLVKSGFQPSRVDADIARIKSEHGDIIS